MQVYAKLTEAEELQLAGAVLLYTTRQYDSGDFLAGRSRTNRTALATLHAVRGGESRVGADGPPELLPGRLLTRDRLESLLRELSQTASARELLPPQVLYADGGRMAWHAPARRRPIYFQTRCRRFNQVLSGRQVLHPPLLFVAEPGKLFVYALESDRRPAADTPVFRAPYFNLYSSGHMCTGNVPLPRTLSPRDWESWERGWYDTQFTHSNYGREPLCLHPRGHTGLWWYLAQPRLPFFPVQYLAAHGQPGGKALTVRDVLNRKEGTW